MSKKDEVCEGYRVGYVVGRVFGGEEGIRFMSDPGVWVDFAGMARRFALRDAERELAAMDGDGMVLQLLWSGERGYYADGRDRVASVDPAPYNPERHRAAGVSLKIKRVDFVVRVDGSFVGDGHTGGGWRPTTKIFYDGSFIPPVDGDIRKSVNEQVDGLTKALQSGLTAKDLIGLVRGES